MTVEEKEKLSSSLEDYLEAILNLADVSGVARSRDIANELRVAKSSVTGALRVLKHKGLVNYEPYGYVTLTETGKAAAREVDRRHHILKSFFIDILGVGKDIGQLAACKAEHSLGPEVIERLLCFIEFVTVGHRNGYDMADNFSEFCEKKLSKENSDMRDL